MTDPPAVTDPPAPDGLCALLGLRPERVARLVAALTRHRLTVATAESITAGLLGAVITEIPGASAVLRGGIICYATDLKHRLVGVDADLLRRRGPVDPEVAAQLARGARDRCGADIGVGLTGVAGPAPQGGAAPGTVYVAVASADGVRTRVLGGGEPAHRDRIRAAAVRAALDLLERACEDAARG